MDFLYKLFYILLILLFVFLKMSTIKKNIQTDQAYFNIQTDCPTRSYVLKQNYL